MSARTADAVVIGGGIVGCATAYYLARRGVRVTLLEKERIAGEQSSRAWGFVRQQGRHPAEIPLAKEASRMWGELAQELDADVEFVRGGVMALAESDEDIAKLEEGARHAAEHGLKTRLIAPREIAAIIPELKGPWRAGLYTPDDGHAEPVTATRAFAAAAVRAGARVEEGTLVKAVNTTSGRVSGVTTSIGVIEADAVICAAGINAAAFAERLGLAVPVRITRSSVCETNPTRVFTRTAVWAPNVAYRPTNRGTFYIGNGYRGIGADYDLTLASFRHLRLFLPAYVQHWRRLKINLNREFFADLERRLGRASATVLSEPRVNERKVAHNERQFYSILPHLTGLGLRRKWAGRMDLAPDMIPSLGALKNVAGFYLAAGFSGHGFALGPVVGRLMSEAVVDGRTSLDISPFDPARFVEGQVEHVKERI